MRALFASTARPAATAVATSAASPRRVCQPAATHAPQQAPVATATQRRAAAGAPTAGRAPTTCRGRAGSLQRAPRPPPPKTSNANTPSTCRFWRGPCVPTRGRRRATRPAAGRRRPGAAHPPRRGALQKPLERRGRRLPVRLERVAGRQDERGEERGRAPRRVGAREAGQVVGDEQMWVAAADGGVPAVSRARWVPPTARPPPPPRRWSLAAAAAASAADAGGSSDGFMASASAEATRASVACTGLSPGRGSPPTPPPRPSPYRREQPRTDEDLVGVGLLGRRPPREERVEEGGRQSRRQRAPPSPSARTPA